ncbi:MAG: HAMP domain-containing protein [Elusimicrobia bacterium]|nr:HAMP domain-containing protein [Elusimicrobiota bacterium]
MKNFFRRKYLVKPGIQIRYIIILGIVMIVASALVFFIFFDALMRSPGMDQLSAGAMANFQRTYMTGFFWVTILFALFVLTQSVFYFHRIIGPLFYFEKVMKSLASGDFSVKVHSRQKDETKELAALINTLADNTRKSVLADRELIKQATVAMDAGDNKKAKELLEKVSLWAKVES